MTLYKCTHPNCGKVFKRRDYSVRHEYNHAEIAPFRCDSCGTGFARRDLLHKHYRSNQHRRMMKVRGPDGTNVFVYSFQGNKQTIGPSSRSMRVSALKVDENFQKGVTSTQKSSSSNSNELSGAPRKIVSPEDSLSFPNSYEDPFGWLFGSDVAQILENFHLFSDSHLLNLAPSNIDEERKAQTGLIDYESYEQISEVINELLGVPQKEETKLSLRTLNRGLELYWSCFDPSYPVIHRPTFATIKEDFHVDLLLLSMAALGATFETSIQFPKYNVILLEEIVDALLVKLFVCIQSYRDLKEVPLCLFQAIVLIDFLISFQGAEYQHLKSRSFHPLVINLLKERNFYDDLSEPQMNQHDLGDSDWQDWVKFESYKRLAFLDYLVDSRHSFLYSYNQSLSLFDIQLELPYSDIVWCSNFNDFRTHYFRQPREQRNRRNIFAGEKESQAVYNDKDFNGVLIPNVPNEGRWPNFLWSLRRLTQPYRTKHKEYHLECFPQYSRYILLHGVLSLVKELRSMQFLDALLVPHDWQNVIAFKIEQSFFSWKMYFQNHIKESNAASVTCTTEHLMNNYGASPLFWSNLTLFNLGLLGLYCEIPLILSYYSLVSVSRETGPSSRSDMLNIKLSRNKLKLALWAKSKIGSSANIKACDLLRTMLANEKIIASVSHGPFAIYISALTCWIFQLENCSLGSVSELDGSGNLTEDEMKNLTSDYLSHFDEDNEPSGIGSDEKSSRLLLMARALVLYSAIVLEQNFNEDRVKRYINQLSLAVASSSELKMLELLH